MLCIKVPVYFARTRNIFPRNPTPSFNIQIFQGPLFSHPINYINFLGSLGSDWTHTIIQEALCPIGIFHKGSTPVVYLKDNVRI